MRVIFFNISWMEYYKGIYEGIDEPEGGGEYVKINKDAHEKFNFQPVSLEFEDDIMPDGDYCLGFVETKSTSANKSNQLHIEKIIGCELCVKEEVDDILVVYCATHPTHKFTTVVGWYQHATVYRNYMYIDFEDGEKETYTQAYNAIAKKDDCILLPKCERSKVSRWKIPRRNTGASYGFGRANVWYANGAEDNKYLYDFLKNIVKQIKEYNGENLLEIYPEE
jgi:hypothetical protein